MRPSLHDLIRQVAEASSRRIDVATVAEVLRTRYWITTLSELISVGGSLRSDLQRQHAPGLDVALLEQLVSAARAQFSERELREMDIVRPLPPMGLIPDDEDRPKPDKDEGECAK